MISFIMLHALDIETTANAFRAVGIAFEREQHGEGPVHLASVNSELVVEIYPGKELNAGTMIGIEVADLDSVAAVSASLGVEIEKEIAPFGEARRMILKTPESARLFVQESKAK